MKHRPIKSEEDFFEAWKARKLYLKGGDGKYHRKCILDGDTHENYDKYYTLDDTTTESTKDKQELLDKAIEEMAELTKALCRTQDNITGWLVYELKENKKTVEYLRGVVERLKDASYTELLEKELYGLMNHNHEGTERVKTSIDLYKKMKKQKCQKEIRKLLAEENND